jgi:hypothetical protein
LPVRRRLCFFLPRIETTQGIVLRRRRPGWRQSRCNRHAHPFGYGTGSASRHNPSCASCVGPTRALMLGSVGYLVNAATMGSTPAARMPCATAQRAVGSDRSQQGVAVGSSVCRVLMIATGNPTIPCSLEQPMLESDREGLGPVHTAEQLPDAQAHRSRTTPSQRKSPCRWMTGWRFVWAWTDGRLAARRCRQRSAMPCLALRAKPAPRMPCHATFQSPAKL